MSFANDCKYFFLLKSVFQRSLRPNYPLLLVKQCSSVDCRGRSFTPERSSPLTKTIDWQTVR